MFFKELSYRNIANCAVKMFVFYVKHLEYTKYADLDLLYEDVQFQTFVILRLL